MRLTLNVITFVALCLIGSAALAQEDMIKVSGIDPGEEVLLAMSARKASGQGCFDADERTWVVRPSDSTGHVKLGTNLKSGCTVTVAAFSKKRAMLLTSLSAWKNQGGEIKTVTMKPPIDVPVVIWITDNVLEDLAYRHAAKAAELYRDNMVGFNFVPTFINVSGNSAKVALIQAAVTPQPTGPGSICSNIPSLKGHAYKPNTLNVYYVNRDGLHRNCAIRETPLCDASLPMAPKADGNVTYMGFDSEQILPRLAHELGHAFGLRPICQGGHPIPGAGFDDKNIMVGAGGGQRGVFTLGQVFRINTQKDEWGGTMLIANKLRPGPGRACRLAAQEHSTYKCPPLNLTLATSP